MAYCINKAEVKAVLSQTVTLPMIALRSLCHLSHASLQSKTLIVYRRRNVPRRFASPIVICTMHHPSVKVMNKGNNYHRDQQICGLEYDPTYDRHIVSLAIEKHSTFVLVKYLYGVNIVSLTNIVWNNLRTVLPCFMDHFVPMNLYKNSIYKFTQKMKGN